MILVGVCLFCDFRNTAYKKMLEYLFWTWDPHLPGGVHEKTRILEEGFMDAISYKVSKSGYPQIPYFSEDQILALLARLFSS